MRRRIHWLLPDAGSARCTLGVLRAAGIELRRMHFVARDGTDMAGLHAANVLQTSEVLRSAERGLVVGCGLGALLGSVAAVHYPIVGTGPQWSLAAVLPVAGALFSAWTASMIGVSTPSQELAPFTDAIAQGRILLMVDVPAEQASAIEARLRALHPQAGLEGTTPGAPAFP